MTEPIELNEAAERRPEGAPQSRVARVLTTVSFLVGSAGLLIAMGGDALAVVGRHTGIPLLGSIEIVQAAIVLAAASAMVAATLSRSHATVHIIIERLSPAQRDRFERFADLLSAVFFAVLAGGPSGSARSSGTRPRRPSCSASRSSPYGWSGPSAHH